MYSMPLRGGGGVEKWYLNPQIRVVFFSKSLDPWLFSLKSGSAKVRGTHKHVHGKIVVSL